MYSFNKTIDLISETFTRDDIGQMIPNSPTYRKVFADKKSIMQQEFFLAGQNQIKPECCFVIRLGEYQNETKLRYPSGDTGKIYSIYRTFEIKNELIELYCEQRAGGKDG